MTTSSLNTRLEPSGPIVKESAVTVVELFVYLQLLDLLTTFAGLRLGAQELSPFIRMMMQLGAGFGLLLSKLLAFALAGLCLWLRRERVIGWINYWYAALVVWNLWVILKLPTPG